MVQKEKDGKPEIQLTEVGNDRCHQNFESMFNSLYKDFVYLGKLFSFKHVSLNKTLHYSLHYLSLHFSKFRANAVTSEYIILKRIKYSLVSLKGINQEITDRGYIRVPNPNIPSNSRCNIMSLKLGEI